MQARGREAASWLLLAAGSVAAVLAAVLDPAAAGSSASQNWPPFVLVAGLLLIGLVADDDRLFSSAGHLLGRASRDGRVLFAGAVLLVSVVAAVLNLDTSVAFLTPIFVYTARSRGSDEAPLLFGCILLSNAASLLLPGSNLTNLIVLGHLHLAGGTFASHMGFPWIAAIAVTALLVALVERRSFRVVDGVTPVDVERPVVGLGLLATVAAVVLVLVLRSPALPVLGVGIAVVVVRVVRRRHELVKVLRVLGLPVLVGLLGVAIGVGTLGRSWSGPSDFLAQHNRWVTAAVAAGASVIVNNLPAASLLSARVPAHPFSLLVGLNLGPNLFVTGSLSWILWIRAARATGANPSIARACRIGIIAAPLSIVAAMGALAANGLR